MAAKRRNWRTSPLMAKAMAATTDLGKWP